MLRLHAFFFFFAALRLGVRLACRQVTEFAGSWPRVASSACTQAKAWCLLEQDTEWPFSIRQRRADAVAVGAKGGGPNHVLMLQRRCERLAGGAVPQPGGPVVACGDDALAVGAEGGGNNRELMLQRRC